MRRLKTLYLSGPDRDYPDADALIARKRALCKDADLRAWLASEEVSLCV